jgi:hypothetical protein
MLADCIYFGSSTRYRLDSTIFARIVGFATIFKLSYKAFLLYVKAAKVGEFSITKNHVLS